MKDIDVFLDLESLGVGHAPFGDGTRANVLLDRLPVFLVSNGYTIKILWGTACVRRQRGNLPGYVQAAVRQTLSKHGGTMFWTKEIADDTLKREVRDRLERNALCQAVLLVADDHGFTQLVERLKDSGREIVVAGHHVSRRLVSVANRIVPLSEILGEDKEYKPAPSPLPFNGIDLSKLP